MHELWWQIVLDTVKLECVSVPDSGSGEDYCRSNSCENASPLILMPIRTTENQYRLPFQHPSCKIPFQNKSFKKEKKISIAFWIKFLGIDFEKKRKTAQTCWPTLGGMLLGDAFAKLIKSWLFKANRRDFIPSHV